MKYYYQKTFLCATFIIRFSLSSPIFAEDTIRPLEIQKAPSLGIGKQIPQLPQLSGKDETGKSVSLIESKSKWTVVAFLSTRCPCTARYLHRLQTTLKPFAKNSVRLIGVNSNANEPEEDVVLFAKNQKLEFPLLKDSDSSIVRALRPHVTPDIYIIDSQRRIRYHGAIDDNLYGDNIQKFYLKETLKTLVSGQKLKITERKSDGCAIMIPKR